MLNEMERDLINGLFFPTIRKEFSPQNFFKTYLSLMTNLDPRCINTLIHIINNSKDGIYEGNYDTLMSDLKMSRATLAGVMTQLQEKGLITKTKSGWELSKAIMISPDSREIVIKFDKEPEKLDAPVQKPEFPFGTFEKFARAYMNSRSRVTGETMDEEAFKEEYKKIKLDYMKDESNVSFSEFVKDEKLLKILKAFENVDKKKEYKVDLRCKSFNDTKEAYLNYIKDLKEFSEESKFLMYGTMIRILNIARALGKWDYETIQKLVSNPKVLANIDSRRFVSPIDNNTLDYYFNFYPHSNSFEYLNAILAVVNDKYTVVSY